MSRAEKIAKMATTTAGQAKQNSVASKKRKKAGMRRGILDGIPISVKDLADIKGYSTRGGSSLTSTKKAKEKLTKNINNQYFVRSVTFTFFE